VTAKVPRRRTIGRHFEGGPPLEPILQSRLAPVYVEASTRRVTLRIGGFGPGQGRCAFMTPDEARSVARALLQAAQDAGRPSN
jgi:hypothetical protein